MFRETVVWASAKTLDPAKTTSDEFFGIFKTFVVSCEGVARKLKTPQTSSGATRGINREKVTSKVADGDDPMAVLIAKIKEGGARKDLRRTTRKLN